MITLKFKFNNNENPELALKIQKEINRRLLEDPEIDQSVHAEILYQYNGSKPDLSQKTGNFLPKIPERTSQRFDEIIFDEIIKHGVKVNS